jgi:hypothetical protein
MIGGVERHERPAFSESIDGRAAAERGSASSSARALQEQHRIRTPARCAARSSDGFPRRVQRKAEENEPANPRDRLSRLRLRRHAAAERLAAGEQRQRGPSSRRFRTGRANG